MGPSRRTILSTAAAGLVTAAAANAQTPGTPRRRNRRGVGLAALEGPPRRAAPSGRLLLGGYPPRAAVFNAPPKFFITSEIALERAWKI